MSSGAVIAVALAALIAGAAIGMLFVGVLMYALFRFYGHYYVEGVGYATIQALLTNQLTPLAILPLLYVAKLAATSISLGSGAP